jgi:hypothetical protein
MLEILNWMSENPIFTFVLCLIGCGILGATGKFVLDLVGLFTK